MNKKTHDKAHGDRSRDGGAPLDERFVARLLEVAGDDQDLTVEEIAPLRAAAKQAWRRTQEREARAAEARRRPRWLPALGLAAALVLAIGGMLWQRPQPPVGQVLATSGTLEGLALAPGARLGAGARIATLDDGRAALELADGGRVRLDVDTALRLETARRLSLSRGAIYIEVEGLEGGIAIDTPLGTVRDIGTRFEIRLEHSGPDTTLRLKVRDGLAVLDRGGRQHEVGAGFELLASPQGESVQPTATHGEDWRWVRLAQPPIEVEGMPLAGYLEWASREAGWRLHYLDREVAKIAEETLLHGSIDGLEDEEALELTVRSSNLDYRLLEGELTILGAPLSAPR